MHIHRIDMRHTLEHIVIYLARLTMLCTHEYLTHMYCTCHFIVDYALS